MASASFSFSLAYLDAPKKTMLWWIVLDTEIEMFVREQRDRLAQGNGYVYGCTVHMCIVSYATPFVVVLRQKMRVPLSYRYPLQRFGILPVVLYSSAVAQSIRYKYWSIRDTVTCFLTEHIILRLHLASFAEHRLIKP